MISLVEFFIAKSAVCYCCSSIIIDINRKIGKECTFQLLIIVYEVRSSDICLIFISVFGSLSVLCRETVFCGVTQMVFLGIPSTNLSYILVNYRVQGMKQFDQDGMQKL